jgi:predicted branched-subunit amino acid permease
MSVPEPPPEVPTFPDAFASPRDALVGGAIEALGVPGLVLGASYLGFGSLVREHGLSLGFGLFSTFSSWALPGQVVLVELYAVGASLLTIFTAVALTNFRFLPMVVSLLPVIRRPGRPVWTLYLAAHLIAATGWAVAMLRCPTLPPEQRLRFFVGFAGILWLASLVGTALGFFLSSAVPISVSLGLVFVNPVYFMLIFLIDLRHRARILALLLGAAAGPLLQIWFPGWGLLATGIACGTAGFLVDLKLRSRHG